MITFQGSADSNYSQPSSELSLDEDKEALRREKEAQALSQLDKARVRSYLIMITALGHLLLVVNGLYDKDRKKLQIYNNFRGIYKEFINIRQFVNKSCHFYRLLLLPAIILLNGWPLKDTQIFFSKSIEFHISMTFTYS